MDRLAESCVSQERISSVVLARLRKLRNSMKLVGVDFDDMMFLDSRHRTILPMNGKTPVVDPTAYIATNASVIGNVQIATGSAVWYGSIVNGENNSVTIGTESHIQDRAIVSGVKSVDSGLPGKVIIGNNVVVGMCI